MLKHIEIKSPNWVVLLKPCAIANYAEMEVLLRKLLRLWLESDLSTGHCLAEGEVWSICRQVISLLRKAAEGTAPSDAEIMEFVGSDPLLLEQLFFAESYELEDFERGVTSRFELAKWQGGQLARLHRFSPKKLLMLAYQEISNLTTTANPTEPSNPATSPSTVVESAA